MSQRIDAQVRDILSRMRIESEEQAGRIRNEIRAYLERAVAKAQRRGLSEQEADNLVASLASRRDLLPPAYDSPAKVWRTALFKFLLAVLVLGALYSSLRLYGIDPLGILLPILLAIVRGLLPHVRSVFVVNGEIRVRIATLFETSIPFNAIQEVKFQRAHLAGSRNLAIRYGKKKETIESGLPGARAALLSAVALAGDRMDGAVRDYIRSPRLPFLLETRRLKRIVTALWGIAIVLWFLGFEALWNLEGLSWFTLAAAGIGWILLQFQGLLHTDSERRRFCRLLFLTAFFSSWVVLAAVFVGSFSLCRGAAMTLELSLLAPVVLLWWRGRLRGFASLIVCLVAGILCVVAVSERSRLGLAETETLNRFPTIAAEQSLWSSPDGREVLCLSSPMGVSEEREPKDCQLTWIRPGSKRLSRRLTGTGWRFFPAPDGGKPLLCKDDDKSVWRVKRLTTIEDAESSRSLAVVPDDRFLFSYGGPEASRLQWSPDGRFLLVSDRTETERTGGKTRPETVAWETATGRIVRFKGKASTFVVRWIDNRRAEVFAHERPTQSGRKEHPGATNSASLRAIDIESGSVDVLSSVTLEDSDSLRWLQGTSCFLLLRGFPDTPWVELIDARTSESRVLSGVEDAWDVGCLPQKWLMAYVVSAQSTAAALTIADLRGNVVARLDLDGPIRVYGEPLLSPEGKSVLLIYCSRKRSFVLSGLPRREIRDVETGKVLYSCPTGALEGMLLFFLGGSHSPFDLPRWSEDGSTLFLEQLSLSSISRTKRYPLRKLVRIRLSHVPTGPQSAQP